MNKRKFSRSEHSSSDDSDESDGSLPASDLEQQEHANVTEEERSEESLPAWIRYKSRMNFQQPATAEWMSTCNNNNHGVHDEPTKILLSPPSRKLVRIPRKSSANPFAEKSTTNNCSISVPCVVTTNSEQATEDVVLSGTSPWISEDFAPSDEPPQKRRITSNKYSNNSITEAAELVSLFRLEKHCR